MRVLLAIWKNQFLSILAYRMSFLMQAGFMIANNFFFLWMWKVLFSHAGTIGGLSFEEFVPLLGLCVLIFAFMYTLFGGYETLSSRIRDGKLDGELVLPGSPLLRIMTSSMTFSAIGDGIYAYLIVALFAPEVFTLWFAIKMTLLAMLGTVTFLGIMVAVHSLAFWTGSSERIADGILEGTLGSSHYPSAIFENSWLRFVFMTIMPSFFVTFYPYRVLVGANNSLELLGYAIGGAIVFSSLGYFTFQR